MSVDKSKNISIRQMILIGGSYASSFIGVGVASGQEVTQYFTNHAAYSFAAIALFAVISIWMCSTTMALANEDERAGSYQYYLGQKLGWLFDKIIIPLIAFLSVGVLVSGAGEIAETYFRMNRWIGVGIMCALLFLTYVSGIRKIIDILGFLGPVLIIFTIIVCVVSFGFGDGLSGANAVIESYEDRLVISDWWWWGAIQYAAFQPGLLLAFMSQLGRRSANKKEAVGSAVFGNVLVLIAFVLMNLTFMSNYADIAGSELPTLALATKIHPAFAVIYGVITFAALYTTEMASYWVVCSSMPTAEKKIPNIIFALVCAVIFLFAGQLPFGTIINIIWPLIGYICTIVAIFVLIRVIRNRMQKKA